jgi:hypothetical protein
VLITTSDFTSDAREYITRIEKRIVLINGTELADLLIEHGVGVTEVTSYTLKLSCTGSELTVSFNNELRCAGPSAVKGACSAHAALAPQNSVAGMRPFRR